MRYQKLINSKYKVFPHQVEGADFLLNNKHAILGDQMGVAKSLTSLLVVAHTKLKTIIVCPAYLRDNWVAEIDKFFNQFSVKVFKSGGSLYSDADIVIIGYAQLKSADTLFADRDIVIFDEAHYLKTPSAQRTIYAHRLVQNNEPEYVFELTGTEIKNSLQDLYSLLSLVSYKDKKSIVTDFDFWSFSNTFLYKKEIRVGRKRFTKFEGVKNIPLLKTYLKGKHIKRKIDDVLSLPPFIEKDIIVNYRKKDTELLEAWELHIEGKKYSPTVKKESALTKAPFTSEYVKNIFEETQSPIVVFTCHPDVCHIIQKKLKLKVEIITGAVHADKRFDIVRRFQEGKVDIICATIGAGSTGFNMTAASHMVFNDLDFVPSENAQAKGRIRRPGQTKRVVYHIISGSKVDSMINKNISKKEKDIKAVMS